MRAIVRLETSDCYDEADYAIVEPTQELIKDIRAKMALACKMAAEDRDFRGLTYRDFSPQAVLLDSDDYPLLIPEAKSPENAWDEFDYMMSCNWSLIVPEDVDLTEREVCMNTISLTVMVSPGSKKSTFHWTMHDKHSGAAGRCVTFELGERDLAEWERCL